MFVPAVHAQALLPCNPPGGTRPRYFQCDDGHAYLVKFAESNLVKLAANEWVGWALANALKLPIFPCALVEIGQELIDAAHLIEKKSKGTDDPQNGLVLCVLHHRALDRGFYGIEPGTLELKARPGGPGLEDLGISRKDLTHLQAKPHPEALQRRWKAFAI